VAIGVLVTDGGPHPPEAWAEVTADQIIDIAATAPDAKLAEARAFRKALVSILTGHHGKVQAHERGQIEAHGTERLSHDLDPTGHVSDPVDEIVEAAKGLSFEEHFQTPETREYLRRLVASHFATAMHIERAWHADRNPESEHAQAFRAAHHPEA
jgi:hypothetical protein